MPRTLGRVAVGALVALRLTGTVACSGSTSEPKVEVQAVTLSAPALLLHVLDTASLTATVQGTAGVSQAVTWQSNAPGVASVSSSGLVIGVAEGPATISASSKVNPSKSATTAITVEPAAVKRVSVTMSVATIPIGNTAQATARTLDGLNRDLARPVTWSSSNPSSASISSTGVVSALTRGGIVYIKATSEGKADSVAVSIYGIASLQVSPKPLTMARGAVQQMFASIQADPGVSDAVTWRVNGAAILRVDASTGLVTALNPGTGYVVATATAEPTRRDSATITVPNACDTSLILTLNAVFTGILAIADCDGRSDTYTYTNLVNFFSVTLSPARGITTLASLLETPLSGTATVGGSVTQYVLAPPGTHQLRVAVSDTTQRGLYTLNSSTSAILPDTCPPVLTTFGVSAAFTLALTCPVFTPQDLGTFFHAQELVINVPAGKLLRVSAVAAGYKAHVELKLGTAPVALASAVDTGGTAIATYVPTSPQTISIFLSGTDANATGAMTVTIDLVSAGAQVGAPRFLRPDRGEHARRLQDDARHQIAQRTLARLLGADAVLALDHFDAVVKGQVARERDASARNELVQGDAVEIGRHLASR